MKATAGVQNNIITSKSETAMIMILLRKQRIITLRSFRFNTKHSSSLVMPVVVASIDVMNNIYNRGLMSSLRFCLGLLLNRTGKNVTMMQLIMGHEVSVLPKPLFQNEEKLKCRVFDLKIVATKLSGSRVYVRWP